MWLYLLCSMFLSLVFPSDAFTPHLQRRVSTVALRRNSRNSLSMSMSALDSMSTTMLSVAADYATEIESAVGEEIYGPIFKAGIFLFGSGIVAAFGVAFIVSKSDAWNELEDEFSRGKEAQLIESVSPPSESMSDNTEAVQGSASSPELVSTDDNPETTYGAGDELDL